MDYCALSQNESIRGTEIRGSDAVSFYNQAVRIHAMPIIDGAVAEVAVCGYAYLPGSRDTLDRGVDWEGPTVHRTMRCARCSERLGVADGLGV